MTPICSRPAIWGLRGVPVRGISADRPTSVLNWRAFRLMFEEIITEDLTLAEGQKMQDEELRV